MNFSVSEFSLGRQRYKQWVPLITQQLRLRHVYQVYALNLHCDRTATFYFTLHCTPMSSPFFSSEKLTCRNPRWKELDFWQTNAHVSSVVIRIWKHTGNTDEIVLTWGINFSGLVYMGNKAMDIQPQYFRSDTVIFFMQGGFFTSQDFIRTDLQNDLPFYKHLNLIEKVNEELVLYKRVSVNVPKSEIQNSYSIIKLLRLQELQRLIKNKKVDVENITEKIRLTTESEQKFETHYTPTSSYSNNIRFAPQLLTMNSLNKMLHEKPTKIEREEMTKLNKKIEVARFRVKMLNQEKEKICANLRKLRQKKSKLMEENEEKDSQLMSQYHLLSKDMERFKEFKQNVLHHKELLFHISRQLQHRQKQLLKELLFIYPVEKITNEDKYTMLGIHLPDSEILTDCSDPGVSVVLGYVCHILIMCSIFLQVPLRYPMKHFGSRSVIYDQVSALIPDKEREFPLYTKGKDKAHFGYAVFLLNKNLSQLRWYFYHWYTLDLKETLKHLLHFLLGNETGESRSATPMSYENSLKRTTVQTSDMSSDKRSTYESSNSTLTADSLCMQSESTASLDKLVSLSLSNSTTTSNVNDPIIDSILDEIRKERLNHVGSLQARSSTKKLGIFKSNRKLSKPDESCSKGSSEALAVPEAYLNRQISKDLFNKCACGTYQFSDKYGFGSSLDTNSIKVRDGIEEIHTNLDSCSIASDSIEQGTDPLDPSTDINSLVTKSIDINVDTTYYQKVDKTTEKRISRSVDSYSNYEVNGLVNSVSEMGSEPRLSVSCDTSSKKNGEGTDVGPQASLEHWLSSDKSLVLSSELVFPDECLRMSLQDISSPLTARTDRLMSTNQSFNLVKNRPVD